MITPASRADLLALCERIRDEYPVVGGGLVDKHLDPDHPTWDYARLALGYIAARTQDDLKTEVEGFATLCMDFLRLQARFMRTRRYARPDTQGLVEELYADPAKMRGYYLAGLSLTYALWPNHAHMLRFMRESFVPRLSPGQRVVEVGVGDGLLAALAFDALPDLQYVGVDISPSALEYAGEALVGTGVDPSRITMVHADALSGELSRLGGDSGFDAVICCEVLEHVDTPALLATELAKAVRSDGIGFVSTVANLEADDHVYLYNDVEEIRTMLADTGWSVVMDLPNVLPGGEKWDPLPVNYSAVVAPSPV